MPLTIPEALRGAEIEVPTLDGRKKLRVPPGTKHGTVQRLRGEGPPKLGGKGRGIVPSIPTSRPRMSDSKSPAPVHVNVQCASRGNV